MGSPKARPGFSWEEVRPPLPDTVVALLKGTRLGYLSTAAHDAAGMSPHLSLMNFTYVPGDEVIIMTTRKDTLKFQNLMTLPRVALLVHDFPTMRTHEEASEGTASIPANFTRTYSITLYGTVCRAMDPAQEERYRALHLANNPSSPCFIVGDNIAVL